MPTLDPIRLIELGERLAPLRDEGVLIIGSGFTTHGLPFLTDRRPEAVPPAWSSEFDAWVHESLARGDVDTLADFAHRAPGMPYAHPTVEHFVPLFVALGAAATPDQAPTKSSTGSGRACPSGAQPSPDLDRPIAGSRRVFIQLNG